MGSLLPKQLCTSHPHSIDHHEIQPRRSRVVTKQSSISNMSLGLGLAFSVSFSPRNIGKISANLSMESASLSSAALPDSNYEKLIHTSQCLFKNSKIFTISAEWTVTSAVLVSIHYSTLHLRQQGWPRSLLVTICHGTRNWRSRRRYQTTIKYLWQPLSDCLAKIPAKCS